MLKCSRVVLISYIAKLKPSQLQTSKNHLKLRTCALKLDAISEPMRLCTLNSHSNTRALNPSEKLTVIRQQRKPVARIGGRGMKPVGSVEATHACKMGSNWILSSRTLIVYKFITPSKFILLWYTWINYRLQQPKVKLTISRTRFMQLIFDVKWLLGTSNSGYSELRFPYFTSQWYDNVHGLNAHNIKWNHQLNNLISHYWS